MRDAISVIKLVLSRCTAVPLSIYGSSSKDPNILKIKLGLHPLPVPAPKPG